MLDNKDYANLTLEELLVEEKKIKKQQMFAAVITGIAIGIITYSIVKNGFRLIPIAIPLIFIVINYRNSQKVQQKLTQIRAEINGKNTK